MIKSRRVTGLPTIPSTTIWWATGGNLKLDGDITKRFIRIKIPKTMAPR